MMRFFEKGKKLQSQKSGLTEDSSQNKEIQNDYSNLLSNACTLLVQMRKYSKNFQLEETIKKNKLVFYEISKFINDSLEKVKKISMGCQKSFIDEESYILDHYLGKDEDKSSKPKFIKGSNRSLKTIKIRIQHFL